MEIKMTYKQKTTNIMIELLRIILFPIVLILDFPAYVKREWELANTDLNLYEDNGNRTLN